MHDTTTIGKSFHTSLKWAWNENEHELFTPIASNKNEQKSTKNLETMTTAKKSLAPKISCQRNKIRRNEANPSKRMGKKIYQCIKEAKGTLKNLGLTPQKPS
jgi:hypothetical protein